MGSLAIPTSSNMNYEDVQLKNKAALDPLVQAALDGDVNFLRKVCEENINDLTSYFLRPATNGNFIHRAVKTNHYTFLSEALKVLPPNVVLELVCKTDTVEGSNPLHYAAKEGNIFTVKLLVKAFVTALGGMPIKGIPPWLRKNKAGNTPLHCCFMKNTSKSHECIARYIVSEETYLRKSLGEQKFSSATYQSTTMVRDKKGASILYCAMREGFFVLAVQILTSGFPYSLSGPDGQNALHHVSKCNDASQCGEQVAKLLLEQHPELIGIGNTYWHAETILDRAVEDNAIWLVKLMLTRDGAYQPWFKACSRLIWNMKTDKFGDTPLHIAARKGYLDIAKLLLRGYESAIEEQAEEWDYADKDDSNDRLGVSPLHIKNSHGEIPLFVALQEKHDDLGEYLLSVTLINVMHLRDRQGITAYQIAAENGCEQSRKSILKKTVRHCADELSKWGSNNDYTFHPSVLEIIQHFASKCAETDEMTATDEVVRLVLEGIPMFVNNPDKDVKTHLEEAVHRKADWLVKLLLEGNKFMIDNVRPAWLIACERGQLSTLLVFIEQCNPYQFVILCQQTQETPLHHIRLTGYEQYRILLAKQVMQEFKNEVDSDGATPLQRAIEQDDIGLAAALLEINGIKLNIENSNSITALDLMGGRCRHIGSPWYEIYKKLLENKNNVDEVKNRKGVDKKTPLHRAIELGDITLAKTLLKTKGVELNITDGKGKTALDLLNEGYKIKHWGDMCREMRLDPIFNVKYLQQRTSLKDMHNTLSVVAALLATITFAAGFTIPGGVDSNDGTATLGTKAAFLVFSVTNTIAMCSSMLVLFTVTGAMIWEARQDDTFLIDLCVSLLQFSLCGTILAFMTGVYAIMAPKVLWVGIVVIILCSLAFCGAMFAMSSFWPILYRPTKYLKNSVFKLVSYFKYSNWRGNHQSGVTQAMNMQQVEIRNSTNEEEDMVTVHIRYGSSPRAENNGDEGSIDESGRT